MLFFGAILAGSDYGLGRMRTLQPSASTEEHSTGRFWQEGNLFLVNPVSSLPYFLQGWERFRLEGVFTRLYNLFPKGY